jgi:riboflavin kinase / FMN adenylyltransferase
MQVISDIGSMVDAPNGSVVTIGAYDGVHLGHQKVIAEVRSMAAERGLKSVVVTFDRHPASVVRPESAPRLITDLKQKLELLSTTGVDATVVVTFDETMSRMSPESWIEAVLVRCAQAKAVAVGEDFHFGRQRAGNVELLTKVGADSGFDVVGVPLLGRIDGIDEPVSSTAIRRALVGGQVEIAARMLGRAYEARGVVVTGDQRGRLLGFPTANVEISGQMCLPADGVYAGWYGRPTGQVTPCAINIGRRPTFYEHADHSLVESHLLDFNDDLYGERARVRFISFLRSERKFDGLESLKTQLALDIASARKAVQGL